MEADKRKVAIICSHGGLDEAYPALILANAATKSARTGKSVTVELNA